MRRILALAVFCLVSATSHARLGETPKQIYDRYGGRVLWVLQANAQGGITLTDKCFLREHFIPSYDYRADEIRSRTGTVMCYANDEMDQIEIYYDRVTGRSIAEIFSPKEQYKVTRPSSPRPLIGGPPPTAAERANFQNLVKQAMLIGPRAANVNDLQECPNHGNGHIYFSKTAPNIVFSYGFGVFGVVELKGNAPCYTEYVQRVKSAVNDLKKAEKY